VALAHVPPPNRKLNESPTAKDWLEQADDREWEELYDSNFDPEISSGYQDLVGLGNCFMSVVAENDSPRLGRVQLHRHPAQGVLLRARPPRGYVPLLSLAELAGDGDKVQSKWGANAKLPAVVEKELGEGGNPDKRFDIIYAVYVRKDKRSGGGVLAPTANARG
jgi:hypothetical protein